MVCVLAQRTVETIWWIGKRQTAVHVAVRNPRLFRLVLVHERMALLLRTLGSAGRKPFLINPRGTLSIRDAGDMTGRVSLSTKMWIVNSMVIPTNIPHSSSPIQLCIFEDDAAAVHMIIRGRSPHLRDATGPCSVDFHKLLQGINWGSHHFHQACADDGSGGRYVDTGCIYVTATDISVGVMGHEGTRLQPLSKSSPCLVVKCPSERQPKFSLGRPNAKQGTKQRSWS